MEINTLFFKNRREAFKAAREIALRATMPTLSKEGKFAGEDQKGVGAKGSKAKHYLHCVVCNRVTFHFLHSDKPTCTEHSDWPSKIQAQAQLHRTQGVKIPTGPDHNEKAVYIPPMKRGINLKVERRLYEMSLPEIEINLPELDGGFDPKDGKIRCSFCHNVVDEKDATFAREKPRKLILQDVVKIDGRLELVEEVTHVSNKIIACPDCSLAVVGKVKWPEVDG